MVTFTTVNHSKGFVNKGGENTNKIEGHWRQAKCKLPRFGVRKHLFSSYLTEFIWRYMNRNEDLFEVFLMMSKTFMAQASLKKKVDFDL